MTDEDLKQREHERAVAVVRHEPQNAAVELWGSNNPREMTARMGVVADAISDVIRNRGLYSNIQGKDYVTVEGWSMTGAMIGVFPRTREIRVIEEGHLDALTVQRKRRGGQGTYEVHYPAFDGVITYEASVDLITRDGGVVGGAVSLCSRREEQWRDRDDNQIASMAQTRAIAKAYRMTLGFVMPMAGYAATPAEEMTDAVVAQDPQAQPPREERRPSPAVARPAGQSGAVSREGSQQPTVPFWAPILERALEEHGIKKDDLSVVLEAEPKVSVINAWLHANPAKNVVTLVKEAKAILDEAANVTEADWSEVAEQDGGDDVSDS